MLDGLQNGFKLIKEPDDSGIAGYHAVNYTSATCDEFKPELDELSAKELGLGRISCVLVKPKCIHAIGRVPKKDSEKSRPIIDCSRPQGNSLKVTSNLRGAILIDCFLVKKINVREAQVCIL